MPQKAFVKTDTSLVGSTVRKSGRRDELAIRSEAQLFSVRRSNYKRNELYRENSRAAIIRAQESPNYYAAIRVNGQDQRHRARGLSLIGVHFHFGIVLINRDYNWQLGMPGRERIAWVTPRLAAPGTAYRSILWQ